MVMSDWQTLHNYGIKGLILICHPLPYLCECVSEWVDQQQYLSAKSAEHLPCICFVFC